MFDKVWHEGFLYKIMEAEIHSGLVKTITLAHSSKRPIEADVSQRSLLSPIMHMLFCKDLPKTFRDSAPPGDRSCTGRAVPNLENPESGKEQRLVLNYETSLVRKHYRVRKRCDLEERC